MNFLLVAALFALQAPADGNLKLQGFVLVGATAAGDQAVQLSLAYPVVHGRMRYRVIDLPGGANQWERYRDRYVEMQGTWGDSGFVSSKVSEQTPPGTVRRDVEPSLSQRAVVTLAVVPRRVAMFDSTGAQSGVQPSVYYTIKNLGNSQLYFRFTTTDIICISVAKQGSSDAHWRDAWRVRPQPEPTLRIQMSAAVRYVVPIPETAIADLGLYTVRVSICGENDYALTTDFAVVDR